jgi:type II secretory pathway pseudopilin PulG
MTRNATRSGQTLIDVLIASGVGAILLVGALSVLTPALRGSSDAEMAQTGAALARGLQDSVRSVANSNWNTIAALPQGTSNRFYLIPGASSTAVATGTEEVGAVTEALVGHWKLDEATTGTAANEVDGGATGTGQNSPTATSSCARSGCWNFSGTSHVNLGNGAAHQIASGTVSAWIKTSNAGSSFRGILTKQFAYGMFLNDNVFGLYDWSGGGWRSSGMNLADNQWHHVLCSFQSGVSNGTLCYVDGVLALTTTFSVSNQSVQLQIAEAGASQFFQGQIDDARLYSAPLGLGDVQRIFSGSDLSGTYTRSFYLEPVRRTSGGAVTPSGGYVDASTLMLVVEYQWPRGNPRTITTYLTRSRTNGFVQGDWGGGSGLTTATSNPGNQYYTGTNIDVSTSPGSFRLTLP